MQIKIALTDDQYLFRMGMAAILNSLENTKVILECADGQTLVDELAKSSENPDLIILDVIMPAPDGIATLKLIRKMSPTLPVLMLSSHEDQDAVFAALRAGANGYLSKNASAEELQQAITNILRDGFYLQVPSPDLSHLKMDFAPNNLGAEQLISKREREILSLICQQYTNAQIGEKLSISERTVEGHRNNLINKTNSKNVIGLLVFALKHRLVSLNDILGKSNF
ncbi:MAG: response regulator transcription factor [Pedobacter sp.]|uniref:response regulator transcription factor n=1 Tax=Pedobacter sp. TaxID=1411316 RepID=UPI002807975C|nr:response regulator transcription factor [Pedobacter sp.]MDQ8004102.1 response regulator transcription factor [Pedobacter sp.]